MVEYSHQHIFILVSIEISEDELEDQLYSPCLLVSRNTQSTILRD